MPQYSQEQLWKLFDKLPDPIKNSVLSPETADTIREICERHNIKNEDVSKLARETGNILMGLLPPQEFAETLETELDIDSDKAEKISREVNRFILFPVKDSLKEFYKEIKFAPGGRIMKPEPEEKSLPSLEKEKAEEKIEKKEIKKEEKPETTDIYREPIE